MPEKDDVPALLPAEGQRPLAHGLQYVAVTDGCRDHIDTGVPHRMMQAEVGHHRHYESVVGKITAFTQRKCAQRKDLIAVDDLAIGVDGETAISVPVMRDTGVGTVRNHGGPQGVQLGCAAAVVDPETVPVRMQGNHVSTSGTQHMWRQRRRGSLRTVDHDPETGHRGGNSRQQEVRVALHKCRIVADAPDRRPGGTVRRGGGETAGDLVLDLVREFVAPGREQLDAVVRHGVVARREHHPEGRARADHRVRHRRCGHDTDPQDVRASRRKTRDDGGFQELPGWPRVAPHDHNRMPAAGGMMLSEHPDGRGRQRQRQLGGEVGIGDPTHTIRTEEPRHCKIPRSQRVSACCTGVPSGPS